MDHRKTQPEIRILLIVVVALTFSGCRTRDYQRRADKEAYKILGKAQEQVGGPEDAFSIETEYTDRDHLAIPPEEILEERGVAERFELDADGSILQRN